ncbi:MAG TPA: VWA domain-containing protein [Blastocatellia bacterium]|nr:VWA domain-containing protein [Blastocatellia bacterium]
MFKGLRLRRQLLGLLAVPLLLTNFAQAQSGRRPPQTNPQQQSSDDVIRLRADEVLLNVTIADPYGRQATDLSREEFIIAEDGKRQDIASFLISSVPVNVVLMLDASGSIITEINSLRDAAMQFVEQLGPEDKLSVVEFHTKVELIQDWTSKAEDVRHALAWRFKPGMVMTKDGHFEQGSTSLYDAVYATAEEQLSKVQGRKAIIILTDGDDTSSKVTYDQALASMIRSGAMVYVVSKARAFITEINSHYGGKLGRVFGTASGAQAFVARLERAERIMTDLSTRTGGKIFSPLKEEEMKNVYAQVARELKNQYIITYVSKNEARDGGLRQVRVYLTRSGYSARTRESYYAPKK